MSRLLVSSNFYSVLHNYCCLCLTWLSTGSAEFGGKEKKRTACVNVGTKRGLVTSTHAVINLRSADGTALNNDLVGSVHAFVLAGVKPSHDISSRQWPASIHVNFSASEDTNSHKGSSNYNDSIVMDVNSCALVSTERQVDIRKLFAAVH